MYKCGVLVSQMTRSKLEEYLNYINSIPFIKRDCLNLPSNLTFGCEIEVDKLSLENGRKLIPSYNEGYGVDDKYICFEDGSVDAEFITPICTDNVKTWKRMEYILKDLQEKGAIITGKTSGHVHFGTHLIDTREKLANLIKVFCVFEPLFFKFGYGLKNEAEFFHYCWKEINRSTYTRVMNPEDVNEFIKVADNPNTSDYDFCLAFLKFLHCEVFTRPVLNLRNFDFEKIVGQEIADRVNYDLYKQDIFSSVIPKGDHGEIRCYSGTLDVRIWQNNVELVERVIYAIANNLVDMEYINRRFAYYRRKKYIFYRNLKDYSCANCLPYHDVYNALIDSFNVDDLEGALWFADQFYTLFPNDEPAKEIFLKQYFKLFGNSDWTLMLK